MPSKNPAQRLRDIIDNIDAIREFTARLNRHEYEGLDTKLIWYTVQHSLGELRTAAAMELASLAASEL